MTKNEVIQAINDEKLVVIIRMDEQKDVPRVIDALIEGGVKVMEITSNTPGYLEEIVEVRAKYPTILVGAGTVTNPDIAKEAIKSGAQFVVTPNTNPEVVSLSHAHDVPVLMGAFSPTEIYNAVVAGADAVKLFPISSMGVDYFKAIKGPLHDVNFFAVGGVSADTIPEWKSAGVSGFGVGGKLVRPVHDQNDYDEIVSLAKKIRKVIHE